MGRKELESLFLAFRERGDVGALAQVFDRTSDELLTLALHLVPEPAQADDVVQATFLTAIQRAESFDNSRALMPWLVGILANQAARARQQRAQTPDPARIETRVQPDPSDELERAEVARILYEAVDGLPEPYRAAVKRHVLDGERAVDIARQSGVAAGTVRMHILRGLERLRRALPAGLFGVGPWSMRGTDAVRATVLDAARAKARILAASATTSATAGISATVSSIGGVLMTIKILLGTGALVVVALFLWNLAPAPAPSIVPLAASPSKGTSDLDAPATSAREPIAPKLQAASSAPGAGSELTTVAPGLWLDGTVTGLGGQSAEQTTVLVQRPAHAAVTATCDKAGRFRLDVTSLFQEAASDQLIVSADHPANRHGAACSSVSSAEVERARSMRVEIACDVRMVPFAVIKGRAETASDVPHGEIQLKLFPADGKEVWSDMVFPTRPDPATGVFTIVTQDGGSEILRAFCEGLLPCARNVEVVLGETTDVGLIRLEAGGAAIEGRVALTFDDGLEGLHVFAFRAEASPHETVRFPGGEARFDGRSQLADVDEQGRFRITGLTAGKWYLELRYGDGRMENPTHVMDLPVACTAPARDVVLGKDLGRIVVQTRTRGVSRARIRLTLRSADRVSDSEAVTDERGCTTFFSDRSMDLELILKPRGIEPVQVSLPPAPRAPDMVQTVELPEDRHGTLVLEPSGSSPAVVFVKLHAGDLDPLEWGHTPTLRYEVRLLDGKFTIAEVPTGHWKALISPVAAGWEHGSGGGEFLADEVLAVDVVSGESRTQPIRFRAAGRVRFEIDGWVGIKESQELATVTLVDSRGRAMPTMFATRRIMNWSLTAIPKGLPLVRRGPDAPPVGRYFLDTVGRRPSQEIQLDAPDEFAPGLPPGDYRITVDGRDWISSPVAFHVRAGATTEVRIPVRRR